MYTKSLAILGSLMALNAGFAMDGEMEQRKSGNPLKKFTTKHYEEEENPIETCLSNLAQIRNKVHPPPPPLTMEDHKLKNTPMLTWVEFAQRYSNAPLKSVSPINEQKKHPMHVVVSPRATSPRKDKASLSPSTSLPVRERPMIDDNTYSG